MRRSFFAAGILCMSFIMGMSAPIPAGAAGNVFAADILEDGTASLRCTDPTLTQVEVPAEFEGMTVTELAAGAFSGCGKLTAVTLPDTLKGIGEQAFSGCSSLEEITIPRSVSSIGSYAFDSAEGLTAIHVEEGCAAYKDDGGVLLSGDGTQLIKYPEARPDAAYTVPDGCTALLDWSFVGSQYLEEIDLNGVQSIGEDAFYYCVELKSAAVPEGVTDLPGAVFGYCVELSDITLPSTLRSVGNSCFYSCTSLSEAVLPEGLISIGDHAFFHCVDLKAIVVPKSVTTVMYNCLGYYYNDQTRQEEVQEDVILYVHKGSAVKQYAKTNGIAYEILSDFNILYVLLGCMAAVIVILLAAIAAVLVRRSKKEGNV